MDDNALDKQLEVLQFYFKKNMLDLSIEDVLSKVQQQPGIRLGAQLGRTKCLNYSSGACPVQHQSISVGVDQDYQDFYYDNIRSIDFYVCDKNWFVNFTQLREVQGSSWSDEEVREFLDRKPDRTFMDQEALADLNRKAHERYLERLALVGSKLLRPVSKPLHKDFGFISQLIHTYRNRKISLYSSSLGNHMIEDNFHEPIEDNSYVVELDDEGFDVSGEEDHSK
jgi:hypothetical protein